TILDTLHQVLSEEPVPPRRLWSKVPRDLETICLKCLAKAPRRRYASAEALAEDLGRFLASQPIVARPAGRLERTLKWCRRRPAGRQRPGGGQFAGRRRLVHRRVAGGA